MRFSGLLISGSPPNADAAGSWRGNGGLHCFLTLSVSTEYFHSSLCMVYSDVNATNLRWEHKTASKKLNTVIMITVRFVYVGMHRVGIQ